jgi:hypothetical protein
MEETKAARTRIISPAVQAALLFNALEALDAREAQEIAECSPEGIRKRYAAKREKVIGDAPEPVTKLLAKLRAPEPAIEPGDPL